MAKNFRLLHIDIMLAISPFNSFCPKHCCFSGTHTTNELTVGRTGGRTDTWRRMYEYVVRRGLVEASAELGLLVLLSKHCMTATGWSLKPIWRRDLIEWNRAEQKTEAIKPSTATIKWRRRFVDGYASL